MTTIVPAAMLAADVPTEAEVATKRPGDVVQVAFAQTGAFLTGTALIPIDDTIPQIGEGTEFLTCAITPTSATSKLLIEVVLPITATTAVNVVAALFRDAGANALAASTRFIPANAQMNQMAFRTMVDAGSTDATTFRVRAGPSAAATVSINGFSGARYLGGVFNTSISVTEIKV